MKKYTGHHIPSNEHWLILGISKEKNIVCVAGYPPTMAKLSDMVSIKEGGELNAEEIAYRTKAFGSREWDDHYDIPSNPIMRTICDPDEQKTYYPFQCEDCGFKACSSKCAGGGQIADTGDYSDPLCPICGSNKIIDTENLTPAIPGQSLLPMLQKLILKEKSGKGREYYPGQTADTLQGICDAYMCEHAENMKDYAAWEKVQDRNLLLDAEISFLKSELNRYESLV